MYTKISVADLILKTSDEASKLAPTGKNDHPIVIHCGGHEEKWNSKDLCHKYYLGSAKCCEGSEADRYYNIAFDIEDEKEIPTDGIPLRKTA